MPEFQVSYEIARFLSRSRYGTAGAEFSRAMQAYSPPVHRNGGTAVRVNVMVADNRSREVVLKTERQKPPVEILFRNMTSSAIVNVTRNSL
jgi:hypothetical protein